MAFVIALDLVHCGQNVLHRLKGEQSPSSRQAVTETGFLGNDGPARGQITRAAVAEPAAAQPDVLVFGHGKLSARTQYVISIALEFAGDFNRIGPSPTVFLEETLDGRLPAHRQLEAHRPAPRQIDQLHELTVLRPVIRFSIVHNVLARVMPGRNGRVRTARSFVRILPQIHNHGLARRNPVKAFQGDLAIRPSKILAIAEMHVVCRQRSNRFLIPLRNLHLRGNRVCFHINTARADQMFFAKFLSAGDVQKPIGLLV